MYHYAIQLKDSPWAPVVRAEDAWAAVQYFQSEHAECEHIITDVAVIPVQAMGMLKMHFIEVPHLWSCLATTKMIIMQHMLAQVPLGTVLKAKLEQHKREDEQ